ncbi:MAG: hypothetical protein EB060_00830 [Proteobacteria bacterium]|nr:hypothetical protein [Pseudomonadota bacterium]
MSLQHRLKHFAVVTIALSTFGCGFEPIYKATDRSDGAAFPVQIENIEGSRLGQEMRIQLENLMNPTSKPITARYSLNVKIKQDLQPLVIERDRRISRYNLSLTSKYALKDIETGKKVAEGTSKVVGSYDAVEASDFSTYAAEKDTEMRLAREGAKDIKVRLMSFLRQAEEQKSKPVAPQNSPLAEDPVELPKTNLEIQQ